MDDFGRDLAVALYWLLGLAATGFIISITLGILILTGVL